MQRESSSSVRNMKFMYTDRRAASFMLMVAARLASVAYVVDNKEKRQSMVVREIMLVEASRPRCMRRLASGG
jgi:hypothetical protein